MVQKNASGLNDPINESQGGTNADNFDDARTNMGLNPLIAEKTLTYLVLTTDRGKLIHYSGAGGVDLTLTAAATLGDGFNFILRNDAAANITINPNGAELINGAATLAVEPGQAVSVFCTGTAFYTEGQAAAVDGANVALSNLAGVAINTSLVSDTDITDNLGSPAIRWNNVYLANLETGDTAADTLTISAWDVNGAVSVPFITLTANNTPTCSLSGDVTGVTQAPADNSTKLATTAYADAAAAGSGANTALSNLAAVAINTSLISDTDVTDNLGSQAIRWNNIYAATLQTGDTAADTLQIGAWDVDGAVLTPFITLTANNTPTCVLASGVTGTTQAPATNNTTLATTAYADAAAAAVAPTYPISLANGGTNKNLTASNGGIVWSDADSMEILAGTATANQMLQSGSSATPAWSTATWPATTTINQILYSSANNTVAGLATANSAALVTTSAGVPVLSSSMTNGQLIIGSTGATPVAASVTQGTNMTITAGAGTLSFASKGGLLGIQIFTSGTAQTYTPTSGTNNIVIELIGGGAGGGGTAATSGTQAAAGGGGGAGGYLRKLVTGMSGLTGTYTVGAAANGGSAGNNNGTAGNNTTFQINSITYTAQGGSAGGGSPASAGTGSLGTGGAGGSPTTGDLNVSGGIGGTGAVINSGGIVIAVNAAGGVSPLYSTQSTPVTFNVGASTAGSDGGLYGGGGAGAYSQGTQTAKAGGNGRPGLIIVWEYS